jgi:EmrB/QacA subfamily drug resistance transporter
MMAAEPSRLATRPSRLILMLLCGVQLLVVLDASIVNIALPAMQRALGFSQQNLQWVPSGYVLTFGGLLLLGGRAADLIGRRLVLNVGATLFALSSLAGGLANSEGLLIGARLAQGVGAALMSPAALSLLTTTFTHGRDRVRALAAYGAVSAGGGALGVILGGLLTSGPGWRWVLFVNIPVAAAILAVTPLLIRGERGSGTRAGLDGRGALLVTAGLTVLTYTLIRAATIGWAAPATIAGLAGAAVLLAAFVLNEARAAAPLMPLRIFTVPGLAAANGVVLLAFGAVFSVFFFLSLDMQEVLGYSATKTGLAFLPLPLGIMAVAGATSRIIERAGTKPPMAAGSAILAGGLLLLGRLPAHGSYLADILPAILIVAVGGGMALIATINAANHGVAPSEAGLAAALLNTFQRLGGALALAALSAVATARSRALAAAGAGPAHVLTGGFDRAFLVGAALALAASVLALTSPRARPQPATPPAGSRSDDTPATPAVRAGKPEPGARS